MRGRQARVRKIHLPSGLVANCTGCAAAKQEELRNESTACGPLALNHDVFSVHGTFNASTSLMNANENEFDETIQLSGLELDELLKAQRKDSAESTSEHTASVTRSE
jgi:hypothetical protein